MRTSELALGFAADIIVAGTTAVGKERELAFVAEAKLAEFELMGRFALRLVRSTLVDIQPAERHSAEIRIVEPCPAERLLVGSSILAGSPSVLFLAVHPFVLVAVFETRLQAEALLATSLQAVTPETRSWPERRWA